MDFATPRMVLDMFETQNALNIALDGPDWATTTRHDYQLAIADECMEIINHIGWKWWKASPEPSPVQVQIEVVDIWHFLMSAILRDRPTEIGPLAFGAETGVFSRDLCAHTARALLETATRREREYSAELSYRCMQLVSAAGLDTPLLYRLYMAKAQLNLFRWNNGYKDGTYRKVWAGGEDNVYIERFLADKPDATGAQIYDFLARSYADDAGGS